ncbi:PAS domain S-box-containing protein [Hydrocarboniphaga daqingensis]|uniref:PAS domain S-box-containing protein n=1 Tax=Hydrocarboniphaga daqingensis TaxID=490188 RepID=A0A1M5K6S6_9GAMM|nr:methyl-accepting chemotaxis protein [Hydrocarboniphaga daqingensis]SHG48512.1 PAS domain S-box-containing protein [Hydrocarboniphaga daqingensis]
MTTKKWLMLLAGAGIFGALSLGSLGWFGQQRLLAMANNQSAVSAAIRDQMQIDMMHDAIHSDVLTVLLPQSVSDAAAQSAASTDSLGRHVDSIRSSLESVSKLNADTEFNRQLDQVRPQLDDYVSKARELVAAAATSPQRARTLLPGFEQSFVVLEDSLAALGDQIQANSARIDAEGAVAARRVTFAQIGSLVFMSIALAALSLFLTRRIMAQLGAEPQDAMRVADRIAKGEFDFVNEVASHLDASIMGSLKRMQLNLLQRHQSDVVESARVRRIEQGLNSVNTNVMIADAGRNIVWINRSMQAMFNEVEAQIRVDLPDFRASALIGANIDSFHKHPAHQQRVLEQMTGTHNANLKMGSRRFHLVLNPVIDADGARLGYVVEWRDVTAELIQKERDIEARTRLDSISKSQGVVEFDMDGMILGANENFLGAVGYTEMELKGRHHSMFVDAEERRSTEYAQFWERLRSGENISSRFRRIHRDGRDVWLQASYNPICDGNGKPFKVVKYASDITQQVNEAAALQQAVEQTQDVVMAARLGDLSQRIPLEGKAGSVRSLCEGVNTLVENMNAVIGDVGRVLGALAEGDLTQSIETDYQGAFAQIKDDSNRSVRQLARSVADIKNATDTINSASREIASGNADLSSRTEQQAASLEETASSMEELTSTVKQNAENARQANQLAIGASDIAVRGGQVVDQVVTTMNEINESSKKVVDIISVIDGIAFQTNILALNAAVEAARAGEQGRGFAVVASEVRSLAQRSAAAAKEIKGLINDSVQKADNGSKLVGQAGRTMNEIVTSVKRVTDIMAEITAASQEQSQGIEQVNQTITQMDEVTQQNAALVEQATAAARSLEEQTTGLSGAVSKFRLDTADASASGSPGGNASPVVVSWQPRPAPAKAAAVTPLRRPAVASANSGGARSVTGVVKQSDAWTEF